MDDTGRSPGAHGVVRILRLEPGGEGTRVAAAHHNPVGLVSQLLVLRINESCDIGERLLDGKLVQVLGGPIVERLRLAVVAVLKGDEKRAMLSTHHHRVLLLVGRGARPLTANVEEDGGLRIFALVELIVIPVALLVGALVRSIEVVDFVIEPVRGVIVHRHAQLHLKRV